MSIRALKQLAEEINSNMRCIEIHKDGDEVQVDER